MKIDVKYLNYFGGKEQFQLMVLHLLLRAHKKFSFTVYAECLTLRVMMKLGSLKWQIVIVATSGIAGVVLQCQTMFSN